MIFRILSFTLPFLTLKLEITGHLKSPAVPAMALLTQYLQTALKFSKPLRKCSLDKKLF